MTWRRRKPLINATMRHMAANEFKPMREDADVCGACIFLEVGEVCKNCGRKKNDK